MKVVGGGMIATIGSSMLCMSLPYAPGLNAKHLSWAGKWLVETETGNAQDLEGSLHAPVVRMKIIVGGSILHY